MKRPPFRLQTILFPTDFSQHSEAAISHVAGLARAVRAKVYMVNVVPWLPSWHGASEPYYVVSDSVLRELEVERKATEASCLKKLETIKQQCFAGIECDPRIEIGGVAESIVACSQEMQADLIMMPTRGPGSSRRFLIGSATAKVLHDVRCPVWTSPHPAELDPFRPYRQLLCAVDYRCCSPDLFARAAEVAQLFHSRLSFVTTIPRSESDPVSHAPESVRLLKSETHTRLSHLLKELHLDAALHVLEGSVGEVIPLAAAMEDADMVVIGRGHLDEQMGHLRTHAYEIIWNSPCPVLSL